ncbi:hypothetical protein GCM10025867_46270 (plasmid) [Frondihabitans sucicola]|uniref:HK97 gp10 family phage protein n=1 Tax=Frondihabitans sucicola TaxID=1268041 RepID=A0ABM8GVF9_9MICO|nr:hypothetical protein [Frondihabitans sucicola]BDZ52386.1 hypothetical protein GCM10025867_46270 [Frondihabitans sucicola]
MPQFDLFIENDAIRSHFANIGAGDASPKVIGRFATVEEFAAAVQKLHVTKGTKKQIAEEAARRESPDRMKSPTEDTDEAVRAFYINLQMQPKRHQAAPEAGVLYVVNGQGKRFYPLVPGEKPRMLHPVVLTELLDTLAQKA